MAVVSVNHLAKRYGDKAALNGVSFEIEEGSILGLVGPNGAGKTTLLKSLLGLVPYDGDINVLGMSPCDKRHKLLDDVCFIADTNVLPRWMKVWQAVEYVAGVHPRFNHEKAQGFLNKTKIDRNSKISALSKGMVTQLHLALVMSIDVKLLVLDEPTLGLDILYRKAFYDSLLSDYYDENRTIIITTHQVDEIESLLTHVVFLKDGRVALNESMEQLAERFVEVRVNVDQIEAARALKPVSERPMLGGATFLFENVDADKASELGDLRIPSISDLFVAKMSVGGGES